MDLAVLSVLGDMDVPLHECCPAGREAALHSPRRTADEHAATGHL